MKLLKYFIPFILTVFVFNTKANAQYGYTEYQTIDGVEISYKWSHAKFRDKDSPKQLRLKIKNTTEQKVTVNFEVTYTLRGKTEFKSGELEAEIKPGKSISGKLNGFYFETPSNISNEDLESDDFEWSFLYFDVTTEK